jgi:hypothetical protein
MAKLDLFFKSPFGEAPRSSCLRAVLADPCAGARVVCKAHNVLHDLSCSIRTLHTGIIVRENGIKKRKIRQKRVGS